jgi:hypothetical protein
MTSIPLKPEYGPTLGRLLQPRLKATSGAMRVIMAVAVVALLALVVGAVLTLKDARYSQGGSIPFSFEYKGLERVKAEAGEYVRVARSSAGTVTDSYAIGPLVLKPYAGSATGELPLFADGYIRTLEERYTRFRLEGEGKTRISANLAGYDVIYTGWRDGHEIYGRDVLLLPKQPAARMGVVIEMRSTKPASASKPVAGSGLLETPLKTFSFG